MSDKPFVLFVCTGNSARSQMAEALLRDKAGDHFEVASVGMAPKPIHPFTIRVLDEIAIDARSQRSKGTEEYLGKRIVHHAVIVCESTNQHCPSIQPFARKTHYWPFEDPAAFQGDDRARLEKFREVRDEIDAKLEEWLMSLGIETRAS